MVGARTLLHPANLVSGTAQNVSRLGPSASGEGSQAVASSDWQGRITMPELANSGIISGPDLAGAAIKNAASLGFPARRESCTGVKSADTKGEIEVRSYRTPKFRHEGIESVPGLSQPRTSPCVTFATNAAGKGMAVSRPPLQAAATFRPSACRLLKPTIRPRRRHQSVPDVLCPDPAPAGQGLPSDFFLSPRRQARKGLSSYSSG